MSKADGGLRALFKKRLPSWQWTAIESGVTSPGVPDAEYCTDRGVTGWVEFKAVTGWKPVIRPLQVAWIDRRARIGGRVFIAVRRRSTAGDDELWIVPGSCVKPLCDVGLKSPKLLGVCRMSGGPDAWHFDVVGEYLGRRS